MNKATISAVGAFLTIACAFGVEISADNSEAKDFDVAACAQDPLGHHEHIGVIFFKDF